MSLDRKFSSAKDSFVATMKNMNSPKMGMEGSNYFEANPKMEDVKRMLEEDNDRNKIEAMKRLIAMISKGKDASSLFPSVVKNVISKNIELKKLVYMYLVHYAEMEPDSSLLAINTFQKDLGTSNHFIRASALRVMSSIRVKIISQLIVLAIEKCVKDSSPYVRKTAAHAISKVYDVDPDQQEQLVTIIGGLLADRSTMVLGSAVAAFLEVCPTRFEMLHPHYRKLCQLVADVDEWGQIMIINLLTRYARTQFEDPKKERKRPVKEKVDHIKMQHDEEDEDSEEESDSDSDDYNELDSDHRLLLDSVYPLLKSRNSGVVVAVSTLYHYLAPAEEAHKASRALVRLVRSRSEIQYAVLANIATLAASDPSMFEPFVAEFFVAHDDPVYSRTLKLEILTRIANADNINKLLKEFKNYVGREEKEFVTATIQAIGRCATSIPEVTDRCLHGLMSLLTHRSDAVVAESVVVIKKLLQMLNGKDEEQEDTMKDVILHLAKILDDTTAPRARASIVWVIGEYCHKLPKLGPDVLRKLAKGFHPEDRAVKIQILNLGAKLLLTNPDQSRKLFEFILNLAKYDSNYDVRDKARLMRKMLFESSSFDNNVVRLFLTKKPVPTEVSPSDGRQKFMLNTLSHLLSQTAPGYLPIDDFPEVAPSGESRNTVVEAPSLLSKPEDFFEEPHSSDEYTTSEGEEGWTSDEEGEYTTSDGEEWESEEESEEEIVPPPKQTKKPAAKAPVKAAAPPKKPAPSNIMDDLFNFDASTSPTKAAPVGAPAAAPAKKAQPAPVKDIFEEMFSAPSRGTGSSSSAFGSLSLEPSFEAPKMTLLKAVVGGGLSIDYCYRRTPSMHGATLVTLGLTLQNTREKPLKNVRIGKIPEGRTIIPFEEIPELPSGVSVDTTMSIQFESVSQPIKLEICTDKGAFNVTLEPTVGELVRPLSIFEEEFEEKEKKLTGSFESSDVVTLPDVEGSFKGIAERIQQRAFLALVSSDLDGGNFKFAGNTMIEDKPVYAGVFVDKDSGKTKCFVKSQNTVFNSKLLKEIKSAILG